MNIVINIYDRESSVSTVSYSFHGSAIANKYTETSVGRQESNVILVEFQHTGAVLQIMNLLLLRQSTISALIGFFSEAVDD